MRTRAAVLSVVPAVVLGLVVAPAATAASRPAPPAPGARPLQSLSTSRPAGPAVVGKLPTTTTTRFVVKTRGPAQARALRVSAAGLGRVSSPLAALGYVTVTVPTPQAAATRASLAVMQGVESVREAVTRTPYLTPDDPQWALSPSPQSTMYAAVQAPAAWDSSRGAGTTIAVLDGGFDQYHPDLAGKVVATYDSVWGGSIVADAFDDPFSGHGTAAASTAAAATGNGTGIAGAAPEASLMLVQVGDDTQMDGISDDASAAGIYWAANNGADVISMSYGSSTFSQVEADAVAYAQAQGVVVVAAAGNDASSSTAHYPANFPGVVSVGATNHTGTAATSWSTRGTWVDVAAPGEGVRVAAPVGSVIDNLDGNPDGYGIVDGTSFSAPMVAGFAAVLVGSHPSATRGEITNALLTGTKPLTSAAFGHGLVQVTNALAALPDDTVLTAPSTGTYTDGSVAVSATSSAPKVRFYVDGTTTSVTADVASGTASAVLPLWGLGGARSVRAVGCYGTSCGTGSSSVAITVTNPAPVLTAPVADVLAELSFDAAATVGGGSVRFLADGASVGLATESPYAATIDTAPIPNGTRTITAVGCNADGTTCETTNPSNAVSILVRRLRPTVAVSPTLFSPNGDGRKDAATITYKLEQPQNVTLRVYDGNGTIVRGPLNLGTSKPAGTYTYVWNGKNNASGLVADGAYRLEISTAADVSGTPWIGLVSTTVRSDRTRPALSSTSASPSTFYPYPDGYRDTTSLRTRTSEAVTAVTVTIYNSSGSKVRTLTATSRPVGLFGLTWNGKSSSGKILAAGTYKYTVMVQDAAGNRSTTAKTSFTLSAKKLVKKTGSKTLTAYDSTIDYYEANCSRVFRNVRAGWPDTSVGYYSGYYYGYGCTPDGTDWANTYHAYKLPSAIKYGTVAVAAHGASAPGRSNVGRLYYFLKDATTLGSSRTLYAPEATYKGSTVSASSYLYGGRTMVWTAGARNGNWYHIKNFTVTWTYYVLA
jgi:subtilisin family serine protease/flagellar hook assembly protein FlgD